LLDRGEAALSPPRVRGFWSVRVVDSIAIYFQSAGFRSEFTAAVRLASVENKNSTAQFWCFIGRGSSAGSSKLFVLLENFGRAGLKSSTSRNQRKLWYKLLWTATYTASPSVFSEVC
jgi:hypothetical protein